MAKYDIDDLKDYLYNSIVTPEAKNELIGYVDESFYRLIHTLEMIPEVSQRAKMLEIGANPYFLTLLIKRFRDYQISMTNYFGEGCAQMRQEIFNEKHNEKHVFDFINVNIDEEILPFDKEVFDCVLFCEIIEHLVIDPIFALQNLHRVLKKGSYLILSTPNVYRYENIKKFSKERKYSIYDPYSGYGIYGRHNREYSLFEIEDVLKGCGFDVEEIKTINSRAYFDYSTDSNYTKQGQGEYILARARKRGQFTPYYPDYLFKSQKSKKVIDNYVKIGDNCLVHLIEGYYEIEDWKENGLIRWSSKEGAILLKPKGDEKVLKIVFYSMLEQLPFSLVVKQKDKQLASKTWKAKKGWQQIVQKIRVAGPAEVEIRMSCQSTFSAKELGINQDERKIGLAIKEAHLI